MTLDALFNAILPSLIVAIVMAVVNHRWKKREAVTDARANARKRESLLSLELQMAIAKMSYAVAMAFKRGHANGEVEEAVDAYSKAKEKYVNFLNEQASDHLN